MCGIAGQICLNKSKNQLETELHSMCDSIVHRGPDDAGYYVDSQSSVAIGMRRLSIIDVEGGKQPFYSECGKVVCVANGEIYNFRALKNELENLGYNFRSNSDCETILHAYREWGVSCLNRLKGMFVFAIWESHKKELFLARDRFGIKPLYYTQSGSTFAFASEIKSLMTLPKIKKKLDRKSLALYLWNCSIPDPFTLFEKIKKLPPGHYIKTSNLQISSKPSRYWRYDTNVPKNASTDPSYLETTLRASVKSHLQSDVPVGILLSGGVDSSAVTALASKEYEGTLNTFAIGFDVENYSEFEYSSQVANRYHTNHHKLTIGSKEYLSLFERLTTNMDEPVCDLAMPAMFRICEYARDYVKVLLSGEGADELLAGYANRLSDAKDSMTAFRKLRKLILSSKGPKPKRILMGLSQWANALKTEPEIWMLRTEHLGWSLEDIKKLCAANKHATYHNPLSLWQNHEELIDRWRSNSKTLEDKLLYLDTNVNLPSTLLMKADKMSMAASIELRVPFLDDQFADYAMRLPNHAKIEGRNGKAILKKAMEPHLSHKLLYRRKKGWPVPIGDWLRDSLRDYAYQNIFDKGFLDFYEFEKEHLSNIWEKHQNRSLDNGMMIWQLVLLSAWKKTHFR